MTNNLKDLVIEVKKYNKNSENKENKTTEAAMMEIITIFTPLIKKYSRKLLYDGAESDLIILILKLIRYYPIPEEEVDIEDKDIIAYIHTSVKHEYIRLSKKYYAIVNMETELNEKVYYIPQYDNVENVLIVNELLDKLPYIQKTILKELFFMGYTQTDLAKKLNISRKAVNKNKFKALNKLKDYLVE